MLNRRLGRSAGDLGGENALLGRRNARLCKVGGSLRKSKKSCCWPRGKHGCNSFASDQPRIHRPAILKPSPSHRPKICAKVTFCGGLPNERWDRHWNPDRYQLGLDGLGCTHRPNACNTRWPIRLLPALARFNSLAAKPWMLRLHRHWSASVEAGGAVPRAATLDRRTNWSSLRI